MITDMEGSKKPCSAVGNGERDVEGGNETAVNCVAGQVQRRVRHGFQEKNY
jgi:hypothetical protein